LELGNIPPHCPATIKIIAYQFLRIEDMRYSLRIPTTYIPRYVSSSTIFKDKIEDLNNDIKDKRTSMDKLLEKAECFSHPDQTYGYSWDIKVNLNMKGKIENIYSKNHLINIEKINDHSASIEI
jgi:hypothetical protein